MLHLYYIYSLLNMIRFFATFKGWSKIHISENPNFVHVFSGARWCYQQWVLLVLVSGTWQGSVIKF